uniref:Uncharacterized protein n=1 Tax=Aegilops tauschii subsp. strangulata TaxID=200361 RepID=A0A453BWR2_AEGTS
MMLEISRANTSLERSTGCFRFICCFRLEFYHMAFSILRAGHILESGHLPLIFSTGDLSHWIIGCVPWCSNIIRCSSILKPRLLPCA